MRNLVYVVAGVAVALALFVVVLLVSALMDSAEATPSNIEPDAEIVIRNDISGGFVRQYGDTLWFNVRLRPDPLIQDNAEASEWSLEIYKGANCNGELVAEMPGTDTRAYGPRVYGGTPGTLDSVGSALLVHDGPTFFGHSDVPGRHELHCQAA